MTSRLVCLVAALLLEASLATAQQSRSTGRITGTVQDQSTRQPIGGAVVRVVGTAQGAVTGADGRFTLEGVEPGTQSLEVAARGFAARRESELVVTISQPTQVAIELAPSALAVEGLVVRPSFSVPSGVVTSAYGLSAEEVRRAPGALGDVSRLIQSLPGVVVTNDQRNDLVVRGGSPFENLTLVDNVEVPTLSHFNAQGASGGPISMLNTELIRNARFLAGGFPASYGNRLSSVLEVSLRDGNREKVASSLDLGFAGAGAVMEGPLGSGGSWMVSARRSFLDLIIGPVGFTAVPRYSNLQVKATYDLGAGNRVWYVGLGGVDGIHFTVDEKDTKDPSLLDIRSNGWRTVHGVNWQMPLGGNGFGVLGLSDANGSFQQEVHDAGLQDRLVFRNDSREHETTLKYDLTYRLAGALEAKVGLSGKRFGSLLGIDQPLGAENRYSTTTRRTDPLVLGDRSDAYVEAGYLQLTRSFGELLEVTMGSRYSYFGSSATSPLDPQAGVQLHLRPNLTWSASAGRYHQMVPLVFLRADPRNAGLGPVRADHYVTGLAYYPRADVVMSVEAYAKRYADYPVSVDHPTLSLANTGDAFDVGGLLMPYTSSGTGRSAGVELYLQKKLTGRGYGQVSYSFSRTRHAAMDGVSRPGSFDLPHVVSLIGGYRPGSRWELSGRFTFASGRPYTPLLLPDSRDQNRPILDLAQVNAARSPSYNRLDLHAERRFDFRGWSMVSFFDLQNAYNRKNVFQYVWNPKTREQVALNQIGLLPVGGFTLQF
jgi:hypothetical protein